MTDVKPKFDPYEFSISVQTLVQANFESQQALIVKLITKTVELHSQATVAEARVVQLEKELADLKVAPTE